MGETVTNAPCFEQSVSFGRFEHDSLCWERWSTFPTNKYLDEVEKCSTPGSVAQKKAYFEAHYKSIAARRAELLLDQEREKEADFVNLENSASRILVYNSSENQVGSSDDNTIAEHVPVTVDSADVFSQEDENLDLSNNVSGHVDDALTVDDPASEKETDNEKADLANSVNTIDHWENQVGSFDDEVIEHVPVKNNGADPDDFKDENEDNSLNDEVSVQHVLVENDTDNVISQENEVADFPSDFSAHVDIAEHADSFKDVNELENLASQKPEHDDDSNDVHEVSETVRIETIDDVGELSDGAVVVDEVVKNEVIVCTDEADIGYGMMKGNLCPALEDLGLCQPKEPVPVTKDVLFVSEDVPQEKIKRTITEDKSKNLAGPKKPQKATLVKKTTTTHAKNKPASPVPKRTIAPTPRSSMLSTPKSLKPDVTKVVKSANRLLDKKEKSFTPLTSKKSIGPPSKRVVPTSLHMSLSLGPANSDPASLTRRSLIMESMGDKDIVKRAFKAFQKTPQMSPSKSPGTNQSAAGNAELKGSGPNALPNKIQGTVKASKTTGTCTGQQVTRKTLLSPGVKNNGGGDQRILKSVAASFGPRVQMQGNNKKVQSHVPKNLELKPKTNLLEAVYTQPKSKVDKNLSQSINSKAKLPSSSSRTLGGPVNKESGTSKI